MGYDVQQFGYSSVQPAVRRSLATLISSTPTWSFSLGIVADLPPTSATCTVPSWSAYTRSICADSLAATAKVANSAIPAAHAKRVANRELRLDIKCGFPRRAVAKFRCGQE